MTIGTCGLCELQNVELKNSHIVSKWTYRRLVGYDAAAAPNPVMVADHLSVLTSKQVTEKLLCGACELLFSVPENYASRVGVQPDDSFPAKDAVKILQTEPGISLADATGLEIDHLTYFAVSVFWRADVAQIEPIVTLGAAREPLRQYLLGKSQLPADADLFVTLYVPDSNTPRIDRIVAFPATTTESGVERHDFTACGMRFTLYTGGMVPIPLKTFSFARSKNVLISDGRSLLASAHREVLASPATGLLAKKHPKS